MMFRNVLRRRGFWRVKGGGEEVFMKHDERLGGIYVTLQNRMAIVRIEDRNAIQIFKSAKHLETYLKKLEEEKISRILAN
ncbi:MAG: hypothetical protein QXW47_04980 [Candidatus Jordarchaeales archaeon]|nr:hypothetical protein [Candidatus Jordarchaeia archaeon]